MKLSCSSRDAEEVKASDLTCLCVGGKRSINVNKEVNAPGASSMARHARLWRYLL